MDDLYNVITVVIHEDLTITQNPVYYEKHDMFRTEDDKTWFLLDESTVNCVMGEDIPITYNKPLKSLYCSQVLPYGTTYEELVNTHKRWDKMIQK